MVEAGGQRQWGLEMTSRELKDSGRTRGGGEEGSQSGGLGLAHIGLWRAEREEF